MPQNTPFLQDGLAKYQIQVIAFTECQYLSFMRDTLFLSL